jgi:hypothetical protein
MSINPFEIDFDPFGLKARARNKKAKNDALGYQRHKYLKTQWYRSLSPDEIKSNDKEHFTILAKEYPNDFRYKDYRVNNTGSPMISAYKTPLQTRYQEDLLQSQTAYGQDYTTSSTQSAYKDSLPDWQRRQLLAQKKYAQENYAYGDPEYDGGRKKKPKSYRRKTRTSRRKPKTRRKKH